jgi:hypothetical protein
MMADLFWPADIVPSSVEWRIIDSTAVFNSALSGVTRTVSRPGTRLACTMNFSALSGQDRGRVQGILAGLRGRSNRIWLYDNSYNRRGSFPTSELLSNGFFTSGTTGWTPSSNAALTSADNFLRMTATATGANPFFSTTVTVTNGATYAARGAFVRGKGGFADLTTYLSDGITPVSDFSSTRTFFTTSLTFASTTAYVSLGTGVSTGFAVGDFIDASYASLSRCFLVDGAGQTGNAINVKGLPTSTTGILLVGDWIDCAGQLNMVTAPLSSNSSGLGYLQLQRPFTTAPANNAPVMVNRPMGRFLLAEEEVSWGSRPGILSDFSISFVEDSA